jgi:D-tyrosyl-tRNA(Tyr) deacylase
LRACLQRVGRAEVRVGGRVVGQIGRGLLAYVAVAAGDTPEHAAALAEKVAGLRVFEDEAGKLNRSVRDVRGGVLAVPNFTLLADARKGRRPALTGAAPGEAARALFEAFVSHLGGCGLAELACGAFGEHMDIRSAADGPVNIIVDVPDPRERRPGGGPT